MQSNYVAPRLTKWLGTRGGEWVSLRNRQSQDRERHDRDQARAGQRIEDGFIVRLRNAASLAEADYPQTIELQWHTARLWQKE